MRLGVPKGFSCGSCPKVESECQQKNLPEILPLESSPWVEPISNALARGHHGIDPRQERIKAVADNGVKPLLNFIAGKRALVFFFAIMRHSGVTETPHTLAGKLFFQIGRRVAYVARKHRFIIVEKIFELGQGQYEVREAHSAKDHFHAVRGCGKLGRCLKSDQAKLTGTKIANVVIKKPVNLGSLCGSVVRRFRLHKKEQITCETALSNPSHQRSSFSPLSLGHIDVTRYYRGARRGRLSIATTS